MATSKRAAKKNGKRVLDMSVQDPELAMAKASLDACLWVCMSKAIVCGSNKGIVQLTLQFEMSEAEDKLSGNVLVRPKIGHETIYQVLGMEEQEKKETESGEG